MKNSLLAQNFNAIEGAAGVKPTITDLGSFISALLPYVFSIVSILLLVYLVMGGLQLMTSRGDPKAIQAARAKITNAIVGFVITIFAFFVVQILGLIFKVDVFSKIF